MRSCCCLPQHRIALLSVSCSILLCCAEGQADGCVLQRYAFAMTLTGRRVERQCPCSMQVLHCCGTCVDRRAHKAEVMRLTQELRAASTGAKGGSAAAERLKKELEKTRWVLFMRQQSNTYK